MGKFLLSILTFLLVIMAVYFAYQVRVENTTTYQEDGTRKLDNGAMLKWQECWFPTIEIEHVECARLYTAPEEEGGKSSFSLPVVIIHSTARDKKDDPVLYMAGGPGSGAWLDEDLVKEYWVPWYKQANLNRDLIIFDQRGAGLSEPKLSCPEYYDALRTTFSNVIVKKESSKIIHDSFSLCYQRLKASNQPIDEISTLHSVADVNDLMTLLNHDRWNLHGVSYSTRLALLIEQKYPEKIRSMVLDSVYPIERHFFKEWPELMKQSLERIILFCDKDTSCNKYYGDVRQKIWATVARLRDQPMIFKVDEKKHGIAQIVVNDELFLSILFNSQYKSGALYDLPSVIHAFFDKDEYLLQTYIEAYVADFLDDSTSEVVFWAVECRDNPPLSKSNEIKLYNKYTKLKAYLYEEYSSCDIWLGDEKPKGLQDNKEKSNVPIMILGGEDDPVTPADWAEDILKRYKKAHMFRFTRISHSVIDSQPCGVELFGQFIRDPLTRPTADCRIEQRLDFDLIDEATD